MVGDDPADNAASDAYHADSFSFNPCGRLRHRDDRAVACCACLHRVKCDGAMQAVLNNLTTEAPKLRRWSKSEYHDMAERGWFQNQRAELIEGEIVVLSPQKFEHGQIADRATE